MRDAVTIAVKVQVPTDYLQRECWVRECIIEVIPDDSVLDCYFGHDSKLWVKVLLRIMGEVQAVADQHVRSLAKNAVEKTTL